MLAKASQERTWEKGQDPTLRGVDLAGREELYSLKGITGRGAIQIRMEGA